MVEPTLDVKLVQTRFQALSGMDGGWNVLLNWLQSIGVVSVGSVLSVTVTPGLLPPPPLPMVTMFGTTNSIVILPESPCGGCLRDCRCRCPRTEWCRRPGHLSAGRR